MGHITDYLFILGFSQEFSASKCSIPPHLYASSLYTLDCTFQYSPWHGIVISPQCIIMKGGECVLGSKSLTKRVRVSLDDVEVK